MVFIKGGIRVLAYYDLLMAKNQKKVGLCTLLIFMFEYYGFYKLWAWKGGEKIGQI